VRARARQAGYTEREVHFVERAFDWSTLLGSARTLSLFAERRLIEIRFSSAPDAAAAKALAELAQDLSPDQIVLIVCPRLDRKVMSAAWAKAVEQHGSIQQIWPIEIQRLPAWVRGRLSQRGFQVDAGIAAMIADRVEGNLLAAHQEIEKLAMLYPPGALTSEQILDAVADSARYDVLQLGEAAMRGQQARALKILEGLRAEGVELTLILWAINKDLQWMARVLPLLRAGRDPDSAMNAVGVWRPRQGAMRHALLRLKAEELRGLIEDAANADRAIKGALRRDPWLELEALVGRFAGVPLVRTRVA